MRWVGVHGVDDRVHWINATHIAMMTRYEGNNDGYTVIRFASANGDSVLTLKVRDTPEDIRVKSLS